MRVRIPAFLVVALMLAFCASAVPRAEKASFSRIVVFGTSLSDPGNAFILAGGQNTPPDYDLDALLIPASPYDRGGHHFSNGATWIEQFARSRGLAGTARPAFGGSGLEASNFAIGGARARQEGVTNLSVQVGAFLQRFGGHAPGDALYVIEMGGNDIRDALVARSPAESVAILQAANQSIADAIVALYLAGARQFLVWSAPDVGLAPAIRSLGPAAMGGATALTVGFNNGLDAVVGQLSVTLPGISFARLDSFTLLHGISADPGAFGLENAVRACVVPDVAPFFCRRPQDFLFWDGIHPTEAGHAILAQAAAQALGQ